MGEFRGWEMEGAKHGRKMQKDAGVDSSWWSDDPYTFSNIHRRKQLTENYYAHSIHQVPVPQETSFAAKLDWDSGGLSTDAPTWTPILGLRYKWG